MGAGMWGTTFAQVLCDAGNETIKTRRAMEARFGGAGLRQGVDS